MHLEGRCLCGAVSYAFDGEPSVVAVCHCSDCQRQTGTAFSVVVGVVDESLGVDGQTLRTVVTTGGDHGMNTNRSFCSGCGSPIVTRVDAIPGMAWIKAGTLDDRTWLRPTVEIWCGSAQPWIPPLPGADRFERDPT